MLQDRQRWSKILMPKVFVAFMQSSSLRLAIASGSIIVATPTTAQHEHHHVRLGGGRGRFLGSQSAGQETPDGRVGATIQVHVPQLRKDRVEQLERVLLARISQNVLTCPTTRQQSPRYRSLLQTQSQSCFLW